MNLHVAVQLGDISDKQQNPDFLQIVDMAENTNGSPDKNEEMYEGVTPRISSDVPANLLRYFENVEKNPVMSQEEEKKLFEEVCGITEAIRRELSRFLFVLREHERLVDECVDLKHVPHCFCESELSTEERENHLLVFRVLPSWKQEIHALREKMETVYRDKEKKRRQRADLQKQSYELLGRFPAAREKIEEWIQVVKVYIGHRSSCTDSAIPLTNCEEDDRAGYEKIIKNVDRYYELRSKFVSANLRLVLSIVRKYNCRKNQISDLIQEGNLGLMQAFDRFDFRVTTKFSTYATWWIRRNITMAFASQSRIINIPTHMFQTISLIRNTEEQLFIRKGREVTTDDIAFELQMPVARVHAVKMMIAQPISLQTNISGDEDGWSPEDFLYDSASASPDRALSLKMLKEELLKALEVLNEREQVIVRNHYGLDGQNPMNTQQLADMFGVTRDKIRQIERYAFVKLRRVVGDLYRETR